MIVHEDDSVKTKLFWYFVTLAVELILSISFLGLGMGCFYAGNVWGGIVFLGGFALLRPVFYRMEAVIGMRCLLGNPNPSLVTFRWELPWVRRRREQAYEEHTRVERERSLASRNKRRNRKRMLRLRRR